MDNDLSDAFLAAGRFWDALASDDDEALVRVLSASAIEGQPRTGYRGIARAFRDGWDLSPEAITSMNVMGLVGTLAGGGYRVRRTLQAAGPYQAHHVRGVAGRRGPGR